MTDEKKKDPFKVTPQSEPIHVMKCLTEEKALQKKKDVRK